MAEIAQEGIACAERQKPQPRSVTSESFWVEAVHHFIRSTVATDGDEVPYATPIRFTRDSLCISWTTGFGDFNFKAAGSQPIQGRSEQLAALSAARRRIHNGQVGSRHDPPRWNPLAAIPFSDKCLIEPTLRRTVLVQQFINASRFVVFAISSAKACRLIFIDAVRGKSFSQIRYLPTRLKSGKRRLRAAKSSCIAASNC